MHNENSSNSTKKGIGKIARTAFATVVSVGMVGIFALPAYSNQGINASAEEQFASKAPQTLKTIQASEMGLVFQALDATENLELVQAERQEAENEEQRLQEEQRARQTSQQQSSPSYDVPSGAGGAGMLSAALAQLGWAQDCTAVVERALRSIGIPAGDLGTQVWEYTSLGGVVVSDWAPGDVLIWPGAHVSVYYGGGQSVHGGFYDYTTAVAPNSYVYAGGTPIAVRF